MYSLGRGGRRSVNIWPGFVDGLATLLLVVIFVLMVFMVAQFFLSVALTGRDQALQRLNSQINELAELLALERDANAELRINVAEISSQLQSSIAETDSLSSRLRALTENRDELSDQLAAVTADRDNLTNQLSALVAERDDLGNRLAALQGERDDIADRLSTAEEEARRNAAALAESAANLDEERAKLNATLDALAIDKKKLEEALATIAADKAKLEEAYKTVDADKETIETQLAELAILRSLRDQMAEDLARTESDLTEEKKLAAEAQAALLLLNRQVVALRQQLAAVSEALEISEAKNEEQEVQIVDLGKRLNVALASKVQELARYRSEFFGRLRETLGDRQDIRVVGDRFVFQSEVLFASGSADLGVEGRKQLAELADALKEIAATIPAELDWVLRVDGHTDRNPIHTVLFPTNWELSTARAISVVKYLILRGIPAHRLAATGFGEFQPLDSGNDEIAFRRNRRIELKLTQR
jgi:chemotaxis protein MotB